MYESVIYKNDVQTIIRNKEPTEGPKYKMVVKNKIYEGNSIDNLMESFKMDKDSKL